MIVPITITDVIDILLVSIILFQIFRMIRGTAASSIFVVIFLIYLFWLIVKALNMELVSSLLGQVIGVGVIALIIVFQQEVRRFLLMLGTKYIKRNRFSITWWLYKQADDQGGPAIVGELVRATESLASKHTGALIVIGRQSRFDMYTEGGEMLKAQISAELLETIFFKNTPLHDGAVLIEDRLILAARCPLPVTEQFSLPAHLGMRHRAAIGMSEQTDAIIIVVSEETGSISVADNGEIRMNLTPNELRNILLMEKI